MKIRITKLIFNDIELEKREIPKLRGYFIHKFEDIPELHNHLPGGKFCYKFPKIQYRIIDKHPMIIAFNEGIEIVKKFFFDVNQISINHKGFAISEKQITVIEADIEQTEEVCNYKFISPWMALNQQNHQKYIEKNAIEKQQFLKNLLKHNLLTVSKGFDYHIPDFDEIQVEGFFKPINVNFKNQKMLCFFGDFMVNFKIPDLIGLGKQSARGFGVVRKTGR